MDIRYFFLAVLTVFSQSLICQNNGEDYDLKRISVEEPASVTLSILDSCVHYNLQFDAVRIAVELNNQSDRNLFFIDFKRHIDVDPFSCNEFTVSDYQNGKRNNGLVYFVENDEGEIVECNKVLVSPVDENLEKRKYHVLDESCLKYQDSDYRMVENPYEKAPRGKSVFESFLLIKYNHYLPPGHYKVFLAYSFNGETTLNIWDSCIYRGALLSNKVDLIVEDRPARW